jgi:diacylglycerol kinase (ATP)
VTAGRVAVIAHTGKTLDGGLDELRRLIAAEGVKKLHWYEVPKSRKAPAKLAKALRHKLDLLIVWGGDGIAQRCVGPAADAGVPLALIPAGTANLLARNLGVPLDLAEAVAVAFHGERHRIDLGCINKQHFAVMAGVGFDAEMIDAAGGATKRRLGRLAYVWTGARRLGSEPVRTSIKLDGSRWFEGDATCVLIGNVPKVFGAVEVFDQARPDDGLLDVGVTTAQGAGQWARTLATVATGSPNRSPFVRTGVARRISIKMRRPVRYEMDGGSRTKTARVKVKVRPGALAVCVPSDQAG